MGAGLVWSTNSEGGYLYSRNLDSKLRYAVEPMCKFRQFAELRDDPVSNRKKGDIFTWDVIGPGTTRGGVFSETSTMREGSVIISQGTLTMSQAGLSVPLSQQLQTMAAFDVEEIIRKSLALDAVKYFDRAAWAQFNQTPLRVIPTGGTDTAAVTLTTNGTVTGTNSIAFNSQHAKAITDLMKERNLPAFGGNDYYALAHPTTLRTVKNNLEMIFQYTPEGLGKILHGEVGRYENVRYLEQTNIASGVGTTGFSSTDPGGGDMVPWVNGKSDWIFFIGEDCLTEAIAEAEHLRGDTISNYGMSKGICWYYIGGMGLTHTVASNARVVKWDSQA